MHALMGIVAWIVHMGLIDDVRELQRLQEPELTGRIPAVRFDDDRCHGIDFPDESRRARLQRPIVAVRRRRTVLTRFVDEIVAPDAPERRLILHARRIGARFGPFVKLEKRLLFLKGQGCEIERDRTRALLESERKRPLLRPNATEVRPQLHRRPVTRSPSRVPPLGVFHERDGRSAAPRTKETNSRPTDKCALRFIGAL